MQITYKEHTPTSEEFNNLTEVIYTRHNDNSRIPRKK